MLLSAIFCLVLLALAAALYVRFAGHDANLWHVDPLTAVPRDRPNSFRLLPEGGDAVSPVFALTAIELAGAFDEIAMAEENVQRLAGDPQSLHVTYIQKSARLRFPDYVSVKFFETAADQSTLAIFSRSRFGYSDRGVNKRRVLRWIRALPPPI